MSPSTSLWVEEAVNAIAIGIQLCDLSCTEDMTETEFKDYLDLVRLEHHSTVDIVRPG